MQLQRQGNSYSVITASVLFALALMIRLAVLGTSLSTHSAEDLLTLTPDSKNYVGAANAVARGDLLEHRNDLFYFPPGYPALLAVSFLLFSKSPIPMLTVQSLLSALTCALIYLIALELGLAEAVARLAGLFFCISVTSIALSSLILSDTIYTFFFALLLWMFLLASKREKYWLWTIVGLTCGLSMLVRPTGKLLPLMLILIAIAALSLNIRRLGLSLLCKDISIRGSLLAFGISLLCVLSWLLRNNSVHGTPVLALTTISAPATVAAKAVGDLTGRDYRSIQDEWDKKYLDLHAGEEHLIDGLAANAQYHADSVIAHYPRQCAAAYFKWAWENVNEPDYLLPISVPAVQLVSERLTGFLRRNGLLRARFYVAITGLCMLLIGRHYLAALILGTAYLYCTVTIGAYPYQGSRYFLPGQIPGMILMAVAGVTAFELVARSLPSLKRFTDIIGHR